MQWYLISLSRITWKSQSAELVTGGRWMTAEEFVDPCSKELVYTTGRMDIVGPHRTIPLTNVPFLEAVIGRCFGDELEKIPRG